jgi:DNA-binding NarL/FixJ family response regulator
VLDRNAPQLVASPERYYDWLHAADPPIVECLLAPFYVDGEAAGTVWVVSHDGARSFDAEDARRLGSLARCASGAYQVASSLDPVTAARAAASSITDEMKRVRSLADGATAAAHPPPLSRREREVVKLVAQGHGNNSIAETLGLSVKSVETYRARAVNKLGASTRAELVSYARGHGLL